MNILDWFGELPLAITITDANGIIIYMNDKSAETFSADGGRELIGTALMNCHNPASNIIIERIMSTLQPNIYTIEKNGIKKLIYQSPWFNEGKYSGLVELSIELPDSMPHFKRD